MKYLIVFLTGILLVLNAKSDPYTDYILKGGISLNANIYSSDFNKIGEFKNCCPKYESAFGLAPALFIGGEMRNALNLFGYDMSYAITLGYNSMSAAYSIKQHIGNDLGENDFQKIIVDHKLDLTYNVLYNEHSLWFNPSENLPLGIKLGLNFGIPLTKEFYQREILVEPSDATFPDGTKEFNPARAELPNATGLLIGLSIGSRYKIATFSDFDLLAHANFNYGLNSISSNMDWNIHQLQAGLTLQYNIPKSDPPRPVAPPVPQAPEPIAPAIARKPEMKIETEFDYKKVAKGDTLTVEISKNEFTTFASILPVLIFEKNSSNIIPVNFVSNNIGELYGGNFQVYNELNISKTYPKLIKEHLNNNFGAKIKIIAETEDEDSQILDSRISKIKDELTNIGINQDLISSEKRLLKTNSTKNPLIIEESRKIFFEFIKGSELIEAKVSTEYLVNNFNKVMIIKPVFFAEDTVSFRAYTKFNSNESSLKTGINEVVFSSSMFVSADGKINQFEIFAEVKDSENNTAADSSIFYLNHTEKILKKYINLNRDNRDNEVEEFILGFTRFDKSEFYLINDFALEYIRSKAAEGKIIEIIPLTDNIGTPEYNENLAQKRASAAKDLIGKNYERYNVNIVKNDIFSNQSPYGRMMNRAVIVRIK
jgi:hypothetical protein